MGPERLKTWIKNLVSSSSAFYESMFFLTFCFKYNDYVSGHFHTRGRGPQLTPKSNSFNFGAQACFANCTWTHLKRWSWARFMCANRTQTRVAAYVTHNGHRSISSSVLHGRCWCRKTSEMVIFGISSGQQKTKYRHNNRVKFRVKRCHGAKGTWFIPPPIVSWVAVYILESDWLHGNITKVKADQ